MSMTHLTTTNDCAHEMAQHVVASFSNHRLTRLIMWSVQNPLLEQKRDFDKWKMCISDIFHV